VERPLGEATTAAQALIQANDKQISESDCACLGSWLGKWLDGSAESERACL
jgi:hypothetical protein